MLKPNHKSKIQLTCRSSLSKRNHNQSIATPPKTVGLIRQPYQLFSNVIQKKISIVGNNQYNQQINSIVIEKFHGAPEAKSFFGEHKKNMKSIDNQSIYDNIIQSIKIDCKRNEKSKEVIKPKKKQISPDISIILAQQQTFHLSLNELQTQQVKLKIQKIKSEISGLNQVFKSNVKVKKIQSLLTQLLYQYQQSSKNVNDSLQILLQKDNKSNASFCKKQRNKYDKFQQFKSNIVNKENQIRKRSVTKFSTQSKSNQFSNPRHQQTQFMKFPFKEIMSSNKKRN